MILMHFVTVSESRPFNLKKRTSIVHHLLKDFALHPDDLSASAREKRLCGKVDGVTRQQRRLSGSRNLPSRNIRSSISIWCWKGPWKNALWGKISTIFPGTIFYSIPNILERYLLSELARSDPMESKPPGDVRHKHGSLIPLLEPGKDPLLDALKNECMEKHTWSSKWLFQVPFYTRYMILHACGTAWHFRYPTAIKSTLPVSPVYSVTLADFSGQEGHRLCTGSLGAVSSQSRGPQLDNLQ